MLNKKKDIEKFKDTLLAKLRERASWKLVLLSFLLLVSIFYYPLISLPAIVFYFLFKDMILKLNAKQSFDFKIKQISYFFLAICCPFFIFVFETYLFPALEKFHDFINVDRLEKENNYLILLPMFFYYYTPSIFLISLLNSPLKYRILTTCLLVLCLTPILIFLYIVLVACKEPGNCPQ